MEEVIVSSVYDGKQRTLFLKNCGFCGNGFYSPQHAKRKFCSVECFKSSNSSKIHELTCDFCKVVFCRPQSYLKKSKSGMRFCSRKCKDEAQRMGNYNAILRPSHHKDGIHSYREIAFRHYPKICNRCGYDEHPEILKVHHRDRDRTNNKVSNLEVLCSICHDLEHYQHQDGGYSWCKKKVFGPTTEVEKRPASDSR